ncbi:bet1-like protein [Tanacetum coccineum]
MFQYFEFPYGDIASSLFSIGRTQPPASSQVPESLVNLDQMNRDRLFNSKRNRFKCSQSITNFIGSLIPSRTVDTVVIEIPPPTTLNIVSLENDIRPNDLTSKEKDSDVANPSPSSLTPLTPPTTVDNTMSPVTASDDSSAKEVPLQMTLIKAQVGVKNNMRKVNKSIVQSGSSHVLHIFLFALLVFSSFMCGLNFQDENVVTLDDVIGRLLFGLLVVVVIEKGDQYVEEVCVCFLGLK